MATIGIQIVGEARGVEAMLIHLETKISPPGLVTWMESSVDPWLRERAQQRFDSEGDDVSGSWLPLSPYTQNIRSDMGYGADHPINVRTGEMEDYVTGPGNSYPTAVGATLEAPGATTAPDIAAKVTTAQMGSDFPNTPPRPVLGVNARDLEAVLVTLANWIQVP
jgi:hypothetical protein